MFLGKESQPAFLIIMDERRRGKIKRLTGFTLIELLIVISIMGLFLTAGLVYYQDFNRRQILGQATKELENNLRLAQSKALAGEKPEGWCKGENDSLVGCSLEFTSANNYQVKAICSNPGVEPFEFTSIDLPEQLSGSSGQKALFKVLGQGVAEKTTFNLSGYGMEKEVIVEEAGNIYIK